MSIKTSSTTLNSSNNLALHCRQWQSEQSPTATIAIVHGLGEHSGRYDHLASYFANKNYAIFAIDLRGHGQSEGQRGHINAFQDYLDDVQTLLSHAKKQNAALRLFLVGHSMGGLTALTYALKHPKNISAVVASGPGLIAKVHVPAWKSTLGKIMSRLIPSLSMPNGIDPNTVSRDKAIVEAYISDPLVHDKVSARWYTEFTNTGAWVMSQASTLKVPALILQGEEDLLVDPIGAKQFYEGLTLKDKHYIGYPKLYHEIFNEPEKEQVWGDVADWLAEHGR